MRIAIYGAGSLGTILGAYISKGGVPIELINRNKAHVAALKEKGTQVIGTVQHNAEVVDMLKDYLAADGVLVTFQNGLPEV